MPGDELSFRLNQQENLRITHEEMETQRVAIEKLREAKYREGRLSDLDPGLAKARSQQQEDQYRAAAKTAYGVGTDPDSPSGMHVPDDDELAAIAEEDPDTARLFQLGRIQPGSAEFHAMHTPPGEEVIELIGPKGPEGFGVIKRLRGLGPGAGIEEV